MASNDKISVYHKNVRVSLAALMRFYKFHFETIEAARFIGQMQRDEKSSMEDLCNLVKSRTKIADDKKELSKVDIHNLLVCANASFDIQEMVVNNFLERIEDKANKDFKRMMKELISMKDDLSEAKRLLNELQ